MASKLKNTEVINTLKVLAEANGDLLLPETVIEAARPETSVLHQYFTWDDTEAAKKCRIQEARQLISIVVEYIGTPEKGRETRVFVSLRDDRSEEGGYRTLVKVLENPTMRDSLLEDSLEEMNYFRSKYQGIRELSQVFSAMRVAEKKITKKTRKGK